MNKTYHKMCIWSGMVFLVLLGLGLWISAGFLPPLLPSADAETIAQIYRQNTFGIRLGAFLSIAGSAFFFPLIAVISVHMFRIEGRYPVMSVLQAISGTCASMLFFFPCLVWTVIAFRPERDPALMYLLNDFSWIWFVIPFSPAMIQNLAIGFAILGDKRDQPLFPRWSGFLNIWVGLLFIPGGVAGFFKTGPFAWNGLLSFWLGVTVFTIWIIVMIPLLLKAVERDD